MSELKLWKNPMTTPSKADVLKVAGEPVVWLWETAAETGVQRARPHPNLGVAVVPLYTETKLLAMYAAGAEAMREQVDTLENLLLSIGHFAHDNSTGPAVPDALWEVRDMAYGAIPITHTNTEGEQG